jgi:hypothetical protein
MLVDKFKQVNPNNYAKFSFPYLEKSLKLAFHQGILMFYLLQAFQTPKIQSIFHRHKSQLGHMII